MSKTLTLTALAALTLLIPAAAADPGPDATVIAGPQPGTCITTPRTIPITSDLTVYVTSNCDVKVVQDGNSFWCATAPRTVFLGGGNYLRVNGDCSVDLVFYV